MKCTLRTSHYISSIPLTGHETPYHIGAYITTKASRWYSRRVITLICGDEFLACNISLAGFHLVWANTCLSLPLDLRLTLLIPGWQNLVCTLEKKETIQSVSLPIYVQICPFISTSVYECPYLLICVSISYKPAIYRRSLNTAFPPRGREFQDLKTEACRWSLKWYVIVEVFVRGTYGGDGRDWVSDAYLEANVCL